MPEQHAASDVKAAYEGAWSAAWAAVEAEVGAGETSLSRILHRSFPNIGGARVQQGGVSRIFGVEVPAPFLTARRISRDWVADTVIEHAVRVDADAIIELGAGFGYNLFNIWIRGGPKVPHHAFEFTDAGRETARRISQVAVDGPGLQAHPFDYYNVDLSGVQSVYQRPLFYSSHSIEQIKQLPETCIDRLLSVAPAVTVLHFEPVGWQLDPLSEQSQRMRLHSEKHGYNENLWPLLQQYAERGEVVIEETAANVMAAKIQNGSSLIRWRKA